MVRGRKEETLVETLSLEELARMTDDAAVRRRLDARNIGWFGVVLAGMLLLTVIEIGIALGRPRPFRLLNASSNFLLVVFVAMVVRDAHRGKAKPRRGSIDWPLRYFQRHVSAIVIGFMLLQFTLLLQFTSRSDGWIGWAIAFPFFMLGFRLATSELVLAHFYFVAAGLVTGFVSPAAQPWTLRRALPTLVGTALFNAMIFGLNVLLSRRSRREIIADWSERRGHAIEQLRMRDELQFAREMQLSMLPAAPPKVEWLDLSGISDPASEVGGDYFDYFRIDENRMAIVCGDVAGHGLGSGLVLAAVRGGLTLLRDALRDPAAVLRRLDEMVAETSRRRMLVTATIVLIDRDTACATIASAGHPPVIFRRDAAAEPIELFAPPLGTRLRWTVPQREIALEPGDTLVLHTDGVYESVNLAGEPYGFDHLTKLIATHPVDSAESLRNAIMLDVERFRGEAPQVDDVTVVVVRFDPQATPAGG